MFVFDETDVQDNFAGRLKKPAQLRMRMDEDGYRMERNLDRLIATRREQGLAVVAAMLEMQAVYHAGETPRQFTIREQMRVQSAIVPEKHGVHIWEEGSAFLSKADHENYLCFQNYIWARYDVRYQNESCSLMFFLNPTVNSDYRVFNFLGLDKEVGTVVLKTWCDQLLPLEIRKNADDGDNFARALLQIIN